MEHVLKFVVYVFYLKIRFEVRLSEHVFINDKLIMEHVIIYNLGLRDKVIALARNHVYMELLLGLSRSSCTVTSNYHRTVFSAFHIGHPSLFGHLRLSNLVALFNELFRRLDRVDRCLG